MLAGNRPDQDDTSATIFAHSLGYHTACSFPGGKKGAAQIDIHSKIEIFNCEAECASRRADASIGDYGIDSTESRFGGIICCNYGGLISCIHRHRNGLAPDVPQFKTQIFKQCCSARGDDDICA